MGTIRRVSVLGSTLACALARAAEPSAGLPAPVAAQLEDAAGLCRDGGGKPFTTDAVKRADLNGDGREDFVLYLGWIR